MSTRIQNLPKGPAYGITVMHGRPEQPSDRDQGVFPASWFNALYNPETGEVTSRRLNIYIERDVLLSPKMVRVKAGTKKVKCPEGVQLSQRLDRGVVGWLDPSAIKKCMDALGIERRRIKGMSLVLLERSGAGSNFNGVPRSFDVLDDEELTALEQQKEQEQEQQEASAPEPDPAVAAFVASLSPEEHAKAQAEQAAHAGEDEQDTPDVDE